MTTILVTGGTGGLGSHVVPLLAQRDVDIRVLTRTPRPSVDGISFAAGDTVAGTGLAEAMTGVDVVLHLAGGPKGDDIGTQHVVDAARDARVRHIVMISVIGAETMPIGYFRRKGEAERILAAGGVPWTVLRAAQFHSFAYGMVAGMARLPIVPVMKDVRLEPVAVQDVAARLVELALGAPQGRAADLAGPEVRSLESLIDELPGKDRPHWRFGMPGAIGRAYREAANLAGADVVRGSGTWAEYLADRAA